MFRLNRCLLTAVVGLLVTPWLPAQFMDDFERADGPPDGWTVAQANWAIQDGGLVGAPLGAAAASEAWIWAGDPPISTVDDFTASFTAEFLVPSNEVGNHGGLMFFSSAPTNRWDAASSGYTIDWIDRIDDFGFRFIRWDGATPVILISGTPEFAATPIVWELEVEGDFIRLYGDGDLAFEVEDGTYREGYFGFWAYGTNEQVRYDDVEVGFTEDPIQPCFTAEPNRGTAPLRVDFDASCTTVAGTADAYAWDFGDGESASGPSVSHEYLVPDIYTATLTVTDTDGNSEETSSIIQVFEAAGDDGFTDDFERPDGDVEGWTTGAGLWSIVDGSLTTLTDGATESWIWAGEPGLQFSGDLDVRVDYSFVTVPPDDVGRHGGIMLFSATTTTRYNALSSGYTVDWIDREFDHGFRISRWDAGVETNLFTGGGLVDPPEEWRVIVQGDFILIVVDGEVIGGAKDSTYREGFFGIWAYLNAQEIAIDEVTVAPLTEPLASAVLPCFTRYPTVDAAPAEVSFDATCTGSIADVVSYEWDFGDGESGEGATIEHVYEVSDVYTVTLTVTDTEGTSRSRSSTVEAFDYEGDFADDFERPDGFPEGWTIFNGLWEISGGALAKPQNFEDAWIWAGEGPTRFPADFEATFDYEFTETPADAVGRHGGIMFASTAPTNRGDAASSGYTIDWIDRAQDHGFRLIRWDGATPVVLVNGTPEIAEPPVEWKVHVEGDTISFFADGELIFEVVDGTYRSGYFGFWLYVNGPSLLIDNVSIGGLEDVGPEGTPFVRGDADATGTINITDGVFVLNYLFTGGGDPPCKDAADVDDSGVINITDGVYILNFLFTGGADPLPPWPACGLDPSGDNDGVDCAAFPPCEG